MRTKLYVGSKIRLLREQQSLTLNVCAQRLGLSPSYVSQIESNQRPVTARVIIALAKAFGVSPAEFDADEESRLIADLREASADLGLGAPAPALSELRLAATTTPAIAHQFIALHRAYRGLDERLRNLDDAVGMRSQDGPETASPYQQVRDFFHYRDNYVHELDVAAEALAGELGVGSDRSASSALEAMLLSRFGVTVSHTTGNRGHSPQRGMSPSEASEDLLRRYDPKQRVVFLPRDLAAPTQTFQLAVQMAELAFTEIIATILGSGELKSPTANDVARVGLANYAAGALLMPYRQFAATAMELRHDVEQLQRRYSASFEQICHRLSTLQRPGARGIPFYFVRVDQAGNITKRHSSTRFQFARFGGACPLWNVHEAFGHPGQILVQLAQMPDGLRYLCVGRAIVKRSGSYLQPNRHYAVGLGCEATHAAQLVYSEGISLTGPAVRIGVSCRICERTDCEQRAFPPVDRTIFVPGNERRVVPYRF